MDFDFKDVVNITAKMVVEQLVNLDDVKTIDGSYSFKK